MTEHRTNHPTMPLSIFFIIAVVAGFSSCGILSSDDPPELEPGPRNYEWTVDTLHSAPGGWIYEIWGSAPDDVWAVVGTGNHTLWHFNGEEWYPYPERVAPGLNSIYGFGAKNVWAGGNDGRIYQYDGEEWDLSYKYEKDGFIISRINDIWGTSSSKIYAVGTAYTESGGPPYMSFLLQYNGSDWQELLFTDFDVQLQFIRGNQNGIYMQGTKLNYENDVPETTLIYQYDDRNLVKVLSRTSNQKGRLSLRTGGSDIVVLDGLKIKTINSGNFHTVFTIEENILAYSVTGRTLKDLFISAREGVYHFNGVNFTPILKVPVDMPNNVYRSLFFDEDLFFSVIDFNNGTNLIYHGTLSDDKEE